MHSLQARSVTKPLRRRLPPAAVDLLLLVLQCLFLAVFVSIGAYMLLSGSPRQALPLVALAIAVQPFVKLPSFAWLGLVAFGLALA